MQRPAPQDLSEFLATPAAGGGGFDLNDVLGGGSAGGVLGAVASGAASLIPGGSAVLGAINGAIKFLGGDPRVPFGAAADAQAPHRSTGRLDMSDWAQDNGNEYARWAIQNRCTVEDIEDMNRAERERSGHSWEQVTAWWRTHEDDLMGDLKRASRYGTYQGAPATVETFGDSSAAATPGNSFTGGSATAPLFGGGSAATGQSLTAAEYLSTILNGAIKGAGNGASTAAAGTPAGQQAKKDVINDYIKTYQLPIAVAGVAIGWAFYKALTK